MTRGRKDCENVEGENGRKKGEIGVGKIRKRTKRRNVITDEYDND